MPSIIQAAAPTPPRTVLVVGGNGFIAGFVIAALRAHGWRVLRGVRAQDRVPGEDERHCDLATMLSPEAWRDALHGVDAVVNAAGILRETGSQRFATIHVAGPLALAQACVAAGIAPFVQISALGLPEDGEFIASKHRFDAALLAMPLRAVVLRPSLVYAIEGSYGGTSLLRALAGFPGAQWLPGDGRWLVQPLVAGDLGELVARALEARPGLYEVAGPRVMALREYQHQWRDWLRIPGRREVHVPEVLVTWQVWLFERLGRGPVGETMWRMLRRGNIAAADAPARMHDAFGFAPRALQDVLASRASQVQDRWQAQLYFLAPTLRLSLVVLWLLSAWAGVATPAARIAQLAAGSWLAGIGPVMLARAGSLLDLALALWLASGWKTRPALVTMAASVAVYTLAFGAALPATWFDPLGGLAKNLVVLPALAIAWVLAERR
jgi:uncharacterized protein YbjT (DUF2867 family)